MKTNDEILVSLFLKELKEAKNNDKNLFVQTYL